MSVRINRMVSLKGFNPEKMAKSLELLSIEELVPYERNTKIHKSIQVDQIMESMIEFGFTNPILISQENGIIAGHGRLMAAKKLKLKQVPVVRLDYLSAEQQRAYIIADNKIAENAEWDFPLLAAELSSLQDLDFDISKLGFNDDELEKLLNMEQEEEPEEDDSLMKPLVFSEPVSKLGDLWILGNHRLLCGSSTSIDDYTKLTDNQKIDMLLTDPPYGVNYEEKRQDLNKRQHKSGGQAHKPIANDAIEDYRQFFGDFLSIINFNDYNTVYCFLSGLELHNLRLAFDDCQIKWADYLIWLKNQFVLSRKDYNTKHEFIVYGWKGTHKFYGPTNACTVLEFNKPQKADLHPTMKPVELLEELLSHGSKRNAIVYEPFAGSGSTLIACEKKDRKCLAMELEPAYCDVIIKRWQDLTKQKAYLSTTEVKFDDLIGNDSSTGSN